MGIIVVSSREKKIRSYAKMKKGKKNWTEHYSSWIIHLSVKDRGTMQVNVLESPKIRKRFSMTQMPQLRLFRDRRMFVYKGEWNAASISAFIQVSPCFLPSSADIRII